MMVFGYHVEADAYDEFYRESAYMNEFALLEEQADTTTHGALDYFGYDDEDMESMEEADWIRSTWIHPSACTSMISSIPCPIPI